MACEHYRANSATATAPVRQLVAEAAGGEVTLRGPNGGASRLSHWGFGQVARAAGAPAEYLRGLPAWLAADCLNAGLAGTDGDSAARLYFQRDDGLVLRSLTSDDYSRIYNADVVRLLLPLADRGWRVPPARPAAHDQPGARLATEADCLPGGAAAGSLAVKPGDMIAPAGLYASDHDMFAFLVNENARIDDGSDGGLARGFFVSNSEVGAASLRLTSFYYRFVCGNHIVWGASNVHEFRIVHRGRADERFAGELTRALRDYAGASAADDEQRIAAARRCRLGDTRAEVVDLLHGRGVLPRKTLEAAYDAAEVQSATTRAGSPRTAWGFVQGITWLSQQSAFADKRLEIDRAAGKVLALAT